MKLIHQQLCALTACLHLVVSETPERASRIARPQLSTPPPFSFNMNLVRCDFPPSQAVALAASPRAEPTTLFGTGAAMDGIIHAAEHQGVSVPSQAQQHTAGSAPHL